jgi:hypothetical protein
MMIVRACDALAAHQVERTRWRALFDAKINVNIEDISR